jgi:ABC-type phosphate transport system substrate-binding protein
MRRKETSLMKKLITVLLCAATAMIFVVQAQAQIAVIANPSVNQTDISRADLRDIFTGASSSLKGAGVTPILLKPGPVHEEMLELYVGKSDSAFRASWRSLLFSGQGVMPRSLDSEAAVVDYVAHTPGAIGYIAKTTLHDGVKILTVR